MLNLPWLNKNHNASKILYPLALRGAEEDTRDPAVTSIPIAFAELKDLLCALVV